MAPATDVAADPENRWLGRFSRRPLSAEELRDTLLALGGALEPGSPGPHPFPGEEAWNFSQHTPFLADYPSQHRSVYLMVQRIKRHPFLALFDGADPNASTGERSRTSVPTQALFLLNNPLVHEQSQRFAARLQAIPDNDARLTQAFVETLGRPPSDEERRESRAFLVSYAQALAAENAATENAAADAARAPLEAWAGLARTLFGRTEFLFVE